jgi:hypothetical protein
MTESLRSRLQAALQAGKDLSKILKYDDSRPLSLADATELCAFLAEQTDVRPLIDTAEHDRRLWPRRSSCGSEGQPLANSA